MNTRCSEAMRTYQKGHPCRVARYFYLVFGLLGGGAGGRTPFGNGILIVARGIALSRAMPLIILLSMRLPLFSNRISR
jgi:hypothetical protein